MNLKQFLATVFPFNRQIQKHYTFKPWHQYYLVQFIGSYGKLLDASARTAYQNPALVCKTERVWHFDG